MSHRVQRDYRLEQMQANGAFISTLVENMNAVAKQDSCGTTEFTLTQIDLKAQKDAYIKAKTETIKDTSKLKGELGKTMVQDFDVNSTLGEWDPKADIKIVEDDQIDQAYKVGEEGAMMIVRKMVDPTGHESYWVGLTHHFYDDPDLKKRYDDAVKQTARMALREAQSLDHEDAAAVAADRFQRSMAQRGLRLQDEEGTPQDLKRTFTTEPARAEEHEPAKRARGAKGSA
jgi:hypothetical protein